MPVLKNVLRLLALSAASSGIHHGIMGQCIENNEVMIKMTVKEFQDFIIKF